MKISSTQSSNLFLSDELIADDLELNMNNDMFADDSGPDILDDVLISDLSSDANEPLSTQQILDDIYPTDSNLLTDDVHVCALSPSRVRARSDFCAKQNHYFDVRKAEDVQKYWCSQIIIDGFAPIPVCNMWLDGARSDPETSSVSLEICRLSK